MVRRSIYLLGLVLAVFIGCTKTVDFDQLDDAKIPATYLFTLVYFELDSESFIDADNEEITLINDSFELPIRGSSEEYIEKVEFQVITENTFDRSFTFQILFFNIQGQQIYALQPQITVGPKTGETSHYLEIPGQDLNIIYNTEKVGFELIMSPSTDGSQLQSNDPWIFSLRSSIKFYVNWDDL
jgi:hypothetical protein